MFNEWAASTKIADMTPKKTVTCHRSSTMILIGWCVILYYYYRLIKPTNIQKRSCWFDSKFWFRFISNCNCRLIQINSRLLRWPHFLLFFRTLAEKYSLASTTRRHQHNGNNIGNMFQKLSNNIKTKNDRQCKWVGKRVRRAEMSCCWAH